MQRNVAGQTWSFHVKNKTTGSDITGEVNTTLTLYVSKDDGTPAAIAAIAANTVVEISSTNMPGWYSAPLAIGETDANKLTFAGKTSTTNGVVEGAVVYTNFDVLRMRGAVTGH